MARAGRPLDDWQVDGLTLMLACRDDGQWACYEYCEWVSRQNGKGGILEARALTGFLLLGEQLILWSAHLYKTAVEMFRRVKALIRALGTKVKPHSDDLWLVPAIVVDEETGELREDEVLVKVSNANDNRGFERLDTGARILFIARSAGGGRGMSGDVNIIDETFDYSRDEHSALLYTLSARPNAQIIYTSSPPLKGDTGEIMFDLRRRGDPTAPRMPDDGPWEQDDSLGYRDWGHAGDLEDIQVDIDDMHVAAAVNPGFGIRITLETIRRELRSDRAGYPRERLGIWPREIRSQSGAVISAELWGALADRESRRAGDVAFAIAINLDRTRAAISARGVRADGLAHWEVIAEFDATQLAQIVPRCVQLKRKHNPIGFGIDNHGPAASLIAELTKAGIREPEDRTKPRRGDLAVTGTADVAAAFGMFVDRVRQKQGRHRDQAQLNAALAGAKTRTIGDGAEAWGRKGSADICDLEAVTLADWVYETRAHLIRRGPNVW